MKYPIIIVTIILVLSSAVNAQKKSPPDWVLETKEAAWQRRDSQGEANEGNFGDVWYSKDGLYWTELKSDVIWSKRHEQSAFVFKDKIWIAGGAAEPDYKLNSEVWSLKIPKRWFRDN